MIYEHELKRKPSLVSQLINGEANPWVSFEVNPSPEPRPTNFVPFPLPTEGLQIKAKEYLESRELSWEIALACNWYGAVWRGPRVIIPAQKRRTYGRWWQGRLLENVCQEKPSIKRWDSPPVDREDSLVIIEPNHEKDVLVVVEGPMDVLAAATVGFNAVGLLGANPKDSALEHLTYVGQDYGLVFGIPDGDAIGQWTKLQMKLAIYGLNMSLEPTWNPFKDLAAMPKELRKEFLEKRVEALL